MGVCAFWFGVQGVLCVCMPRGQFVFMVKGMPAYGPGNFKNQRVRATSVRSNGACVGERVVFMRKAHALDVGADVDADVDVVLTAACLR